MQAHRTLHNGCGLWSAALAALGHGTSNNNSIHACVPAQCFKKGVCRFHFPYSITSEPVAFVNEEDNMSRKTFAAKCNDPWLNQHSIPLLLAWRANVDVQLVLDKKSAIKYVSKYASKPEVLSQSYHDTLGNFCSPLPHNLPAEKAVQQLFVKMAADWDILAQEAVHLLLGNKLVGCSRTFVNLNANVDAPHLLKETPDLDDEDYVFESAFFSHYKRWPAAQNHLNAVDYCKVFDVKWGLFFIYNIICYMIFE